MVQCVAVLADQRRVVSGSLDRTLRLWLAESGQCLRTLRGHSGGVYCVAVLPRGGAEDERVVSGSDDNTLRVWDAASGRALQTLRGHSDTVSCVLTLALPSGAYVVSGSWDKTLRVWAGEAGVEGADLGQCLRVLPGHSRQVHCLAAVPTAAGGCSPLVASGSWDRSIRLWDVLTGHCLGVLPGHSDYVLCLAALRVPLSLFDAVGTATPPVDDDDAATAPVLVSGSIDRTLRFWRLDTLLAALAHAPPAAAQLSGSRSRSNSHGAGRGPRRGQLLDESAARSPSPALVAAPVAPVVASCFHVHREPNAAVYCLAAYPFSPLAHEAGAAAAPAVSFVSGSFYRALSLWQLDIADAAVTATPQASHAPGSRFTSPSGTMASPLRLRNAAAAVRPRPGSSPVPPSADGHSANGHSATPDTWQWRLRQRQSLEGHKGTASCLAVFADGRIVSGSRDETLLLWAPLS